MLAARGRLVILQAGYLVFEIHDLQFESLESIFSGILWSFDVVALLLEIFAPSTWFLTITADL
jgi:hypothetical protein